MHAMHTDCSNADILGLDKKIVDDTKGIPVLARDYAGLPTQWEERRQAECGGDVRSSMKVYYNTYLIGM